MTPNDLAEIHRACFATPRPWTAAEFSDLLGGRGVELVETPQGFALIRTISGECEILTIAVRPSDQGQGSGRVLLDLALNTARLSGAGSVFLEVAGNNLAARALYRAAGFFQLGARKGYYRGADGVGQDALILRRDL